jgi:hypothetical protein
MELNGWGLPADAPPLRRQRPKRPRPPHLRPHHDRHVRPLPWRRTGRPRAPHQIRGTNSVGQLWRQLLPGQASPAVPGMRPDAPTAQHESGQQAVPVRPLGISGVRQPRQPRLPAAGHAGRVANPPLKAGPKSLNGRLRESTVARRAPQKSHKSASMATPTRFPLFRRTLVPGATVPTAAGRPAPRYVSSQLRHRVLLFPKLPPRTDGASCLVRWSAC